ncbi:hypothetical protein RT99_06005 [Flavobacterium sp. MEB061]|uniref:hypothetical protein n=1 Tax=Flavobacterium sp. MEB061 TaxID=1587524 RepID=UPI0005ACC8DF|nr:hypothetical protein [Flavobacterium sp. MEB061]KIQ22657.1 hypothetical protein RT99_06005 [Flavobacterium sp. MEB061]
MTIEILENKIAFQIGFLEFSGKLPEEIISDLKALAIDYAEQFKIKAEQYDKLENRIAKCYVDENGNELSPEESENIDLGTIGEIAAGAFGWI